MSSSQGAQTALYVEPGAASHTFDTSSERYAFLSESIRKLGTIVESEGIRGTRSRHEVMTREGTYEVGGEIVLEPSPLDLDLWLPRILGAAESTDTFALAETLPAFGVLVDREGGTFEYTDCKVNKATFRAGANGLVQLALDIFGVTEVTGTSAPAVSLGTAAGNYPYIFHDGVLTLQSSARAMMDFELVIDNRLSRRFTNSQTATDLTAQDRLITLRTTNPFTATEMSALYNQAVGGAAGTLVFTNGNCSTTFTFGKLQVPAESPSIRGKQEVPLTLNMTARMTGSTRELVVTHDGNAAS